MILYLRHDQQSESSQVLAKNSFTCNTFWRALASTYSAEHASDVQQNTVILNTRYSISEIDPLEYRNCKYGILMISNSVGSDRSGEPSFSGLYAYHIPTNTWSCIMEDSPTLKSRIGHSMLFHSVSAFLNIESLYLHYLFQNFKKIISFRHFCNHKIEGSHITFIQAVFLKYESNKLS